MLKLLRIGRVPALAKQLHRLREQEALASGGAKRRRWLRGMNVDVPRWCLDVVQVRQTILAIDIENHRGTYGMPKRIPICTSREGEPEREVHKVPQRGK